MNWGVGTVLANYSGMQGLGLGPVSWPTLQNYYYSALNPESSFAQTGGTFEATLAYAMLPDISRGSGLPLSDAQNAQKAAVERGDYVGAFGPQWPMILALAKQGAVAGKEPAGWGSITLPNVEIASAFAEPAAGTKPGVTPPAAGGGGPTPPVNTGTAAGTNSGNYTAPPTAGPDNNMMLWVLLGAGALIALVAVNK